MRSAALVLALLLPATALARPSVADFALLDQDGRYRELTRVEARLVVLTFVDGADGASASVVADVKRLRAIRRTGPVAFWFASARLGETRAHLQEAARALGLDANLPLLHDEAQIVARALGATRTGEIFAFDPAARTVVFHGAIAGLARALDGFLAGKSFAATGALPDGALLPIEPAAARPVSYEREIGPLIRRKCVSCHQAGEIAPFAFSSGEKARGWGRTIQEVLLARRMPPWHADPHASVAFSNDSSLTPAETSTLWRWIEQGAPVGDGPDPLAAPLPPRPEWPLGQPDYIVQLPAAEPVPATGVIPYQRRLADFVMPADAWIQAAVPQPGNRAVVHHITVYADYPAGYQAPREDAYLTGWAPGMELGRFPAGTGKFVPKGTRFRFEIHYTTTGKPETDRSRCGLYLVKGRTPRPIETRLQWDEDLLIPAGEPDLRTHALYGFHDDVTLYALIPHMHGRGSWIRYEALYPDGRREMLLSVPRYDFAWQTVYRLAQPKHLPIGTWLLVTGGFDNSPRNPANLDPKARVRWGEQTFDEMFVAQFDVVPTPAKKPIAAQER